MQHEHPPHCQLAGTCHQFWWTSSPCSRVPSSRKWLASTYQALYSDVPECLSVNALTPRLIHYIPCPILSMVIWLYWLFIYTWYMCYTCYDYCFLFHLHLRPIQIYACEPQQKLWQYTKHVGDGHRFLDIVQTRGKRWDLSNWRCPLEVCHSCART
jgi:hypothetical protein